jgi:hypothetical protein
MKRPQLSKTDAMLAGLILVSILIGAVLGSWFMSSSAPALPVQPVGPTFVDLNGDGRVDFLSEGWAVFNLPDMPTPPTP